MADNVGYTPGSGATVAADDIGGVLHQRVKLTVGPDGVSNGDVSATNPLPIQGSVLIDGTPLVQIDGGVAITNTPLDVNVVSANQADVNIVNSSLPVAPAGNAIFDVRAVGELIECLEAMRQYQISLNRTIGMIMPDTSGRMRILLDAISANLTLGTVSVVSTLTNLNQFGQQPAQELVYGALHSGADNLRRNITVS
jgi:hypothetical protein